jgi:hypothetical protein
MDVWQQAAQSINQTDVRQQAAATAQPKSLVDKAVDYGKKFVTGLPGLGEAIAEQGTGLISGAAQMVTAPFNLLGTGLGELTESAVQGRAPSLEEWGKKAGPINAAIGDFFQYKPQTETGKGLSQQATGIMRLPGETIVAPLKYGIDKLSGGESTLDPTTEEFIRMGADTAAQALLMKKAGVGEYKPEALPSKIRPTIEPATDVWQQAAETVTDRPTHENLSGGTVVTGMDSVNLQNIAPEIKPVAKMTVSEVKQLKASGQIGVGKSVFNAGNDTAYIIDHNAVQGIYGGSMPEAVKKARIDLKNGGDAESSLLGYPGVENIPKEQTVDVAVTKQGETVTDLAQMKQEAEAKNVAWAAEGKPEEILPKADGVAQAIQGNAETAIPDHVARAVEEPRAVPQSVSLATKQQTKDTLNTKLGNGEIHPSSPVRLTTVDELNDILNTGALREGKDYEGRSGISAQVVDGNKPIVAYGPNDKISAAIVYPSEAAEGRGLAPNEVKINPGTDVNSLRFVVDGHPELMTFDQLKGVMRETRGESVQGKTSIKNAVVDAERAADKLPPIETPSEIKPIANSLEEGKRKVESGEFNLSTVESLAKEPRAISDSENMAMLYMKQRNRNAHDSVTERIIEARQSGSTAMVDALKVERNAIEQERMTIDSAGKAVGTEWGRSGRARQEMMAEDYSLSRNIQRARSESPSGEITEAHRAEIEGLTKRLEVVMKEAETKAERIANLEAELALKKIQREEKTARSKGERKVKRETLDLEFEDLKKELNSIINPNKINSGLDPAVIPVLVKMAKNRVQKGMTRVGDVVDSIHNEIEGALDKREIRDAISGYYKQMENTGKIESPVKADKEARKLKAKEEDLKRQINASVKPMTSGKKVRSIFTEAWKAGLLSGPKTHIVNITSNALTIGLKPIETLIASGAEAVRSKVTGTPRGVFAGEAKADIVGLRAGIDEGVRRAARGWAEALTPEESLKTNEAHQQNAIPGRTGKIVRIPFRALSAADLFFKSIAESSEIYRLSYKQAAKEGLKGDVLNKRMAEIVQNPDAKIIDKAVKDADYRTFNNPFGPFGRWVSSSRNIPYVGFLADLLMPFIRTPLNIAKYGMERTPLNFGRLLYKAIKKETVGAELSEQIALPIMGTMIVAGVTNAVITGNITGGGPKDKADRETLMRTGWQPYSFKIGDKYYSYNRFEPVGMVVGTSADFAGLAFGNETQIKDPIDAANIIAMSVAKNWTSKTFMQSLSAALDATSDPERYGAQFLNGYAGSLIPSIVNTATVAIDDTRRDTKGPLDTMMARIPGASEQLEPKRDLWGRPIKKTGLTLVDRAISPVSISQVSDDPVDKEILRLGISPGLPKKKLGDVELTPEQYSDFSERAGKRAYERVNQIVKRNISDEQKANSIKNAIKVSRIIEGNQLLRELGMKRRNKGATK